MLYWFVCRVCKEKNFYYKKEIMFFSIHYSTISIITKSFAYMCCGQITIYLRTRFKFLKCALVHIKSNVIFHFELTDLFTNTQSNSQIKSNVIFRFESTDLFTNTQSNRQIKWSVCLHCCEFFIIREYSQLSVLVVRMEW